MGADYVRLCPTCGAENAPDVMRCACGAMLFGVDLVRKGVQATPATSQDATPQPHGTTATVCPYADCAQLNPPGGDTCRYCNRPLAAGNTLIKVSQSLVNLPAALRNRFRIERPFPATGAEAEILLVAPLEGGQERVAKVYRQGILPRQAVRERIDRIDVRYRVELVESGISDGYAYELMEYCALGSLRDRLAARPLNSEALSAVVRELAAAVAAVHAAGLVHRDLKPENVLVRSEQPFALVLTDFGIASVLDATQRFTSAARSLPYASPESLSGVIDGKADYWALGMILLEAALGKHPFAGLSDAVILHHLTTRSVDLGGIRDTNLRKLLRGLLLRDPKLRWGDGEITRWLDGDVKLTEPVEQGPGASFAEPYLIGNERCQTPEQLAAALSRNWQAGIADLNNSQLLAWFRDVLKDQNAVRLLLELRHDRQTHVDLQLLKLMLHLAPGIPPVWRGESIELPAILSRANLALKGDADMAYWLDSLYQYRVLEVYAAAGNAEVEAIVQRWTAAAGRFDKAWDAQLAFLKKRVTARDPGEVVLFDDVMYGHSEPKRPSLRALHPRLLAMAYDPSWSERLRKRVLAELAELAVHCPWLFELGDPVSMDAAALLVVESLLPEARKAADRQIKAKARQLEAELDERRAIERGLDEVREQLRGYAQGSLFRPPSCDDVRSDLDRFFDLAARIRSSGYSDLPWVEIRRATLRAEPVASRMLELIDRVAQRQAANTGWLSRRMFTFQFLAFLLLPAFLGRWVVYLLLITFAAVLAWRLLPNVFLMNRLQHLANNL